MRHFQQTSIAKIVMANIIVNLNSNFISLRIAHNIGRQFTGGHNDLPVWRL